MDVEGVEEDLVQCIKMVIIGDGLVGKTSLLQSYAARGDNFSDAHSPTVLDTYTVSILIRGIPYLLNIFDTAGQEEYDALRRMAYTGTDVFLVCYSVDSPPSLDNVQELWLPEIRAECPGVPYILVGLKVDLRRAEKTSRSLRRRESNSKRRVQQLGQEGVVRDEEALDDLRLLANKIVSTPADDERGRAVMTTVISKEEAELICKETGCSSHLECSAKLYEGVKEVFDGAIEIYYTNQLQNDRHEGDVVRRRGSKKIVNATSKGWRRLRRVRKSLKSCSIS